MQRLAEVDSEAGDARAGALALAGTTAMPPDIFAAADLHIQLQTLQERFAKAELAKAKESHAVAAEHSEQLYRLQHKLAAAEMQVTAGCTGHCIAPT